MTEEAVTMGTEAKVRRMLAARLIEAEWETEPDRFVVLSCTHFRDSRAMVATLRRERIDRSVGDMPARVFAPFQDMQRVAVARVARYSAKMLEAFFAQQVERVERVREGKGFDVQAEQITAMFRTPTTA